ncbi:MAG: GNAT family N-acetyltransferase [Clostridia bacterium]|nr:GNAT family N-acetyltransferase [Clostridia bacterium]
MFTIRLAAPSDWPAWRALDGHIDRALFERKAAAGECYMAEIDGAPAGLLRWNLFWDAVPFCTLLYIRQEHRGRGIGRALMARWEADMRAAGHGMAMTSTQADETAQNFYRRLGWRDAGGFVVDVPGYEQPFELILTKDIRGPEA